MDNCIQDDSQGGEEEASLLAPSPFAFLHLPFYFRPGVDYNWAH
jgi:hypothetical protein